MLFSPPPLSYSNSKLDASMSIVLPYPVAFPLASSAKE